MVDTIMKDLWKEKDAIAAEHNYDVAAVAQAMRRQVTHIDSAANEGKRKKPNKAPNRTRTSRAG